MSEGSGVVRNFSYQDHPFSRNTVHIAPTEYHVGIRPSYINVVDDDDDGEGEEEEEDEGESQTKEAGAAADVGEQRMQAGANTTRPASSGEWRVASTGEGSPLKSVSVNTPSPADSDYPLSVQSLLCSDNASSSTRVSYIISSLCYSLVHLPVLALKWVLLMPCKLFAVEYKLMSFL